MSIMRILGSEDMPDITIDEVKAADRNEKKIASYENGVLVEAIELGEDS